MTKRPSVFFTDQVLSHVSDEAWTVLCSQVLKLWHVLCPDMRIERPLLTTPIRMQHL